MDITQIQKLLGHQHLDTTMIYARVLDTTLEAHYRRAMAANRTSATAIVRYTGGRGLARRQPGRAEPARRNS